MKTKVAIITLLLALLVTSCVQKSYKKTVVFTLDVSELKNIKKVGIRGTTNHFLRLWHGNERDEIMATFETAYTFTLVKFIANDSLEFKAQANRNVDFSKTDTTFYNAKFNKR